ncbi:MAG: response regulator transcription factor [Dehalococcoidales bacterium]|nr:response regulator transcription factor [Dehalococcoidales bacterium]
MAENNKKPCILVVDDQPKLLRFIEIRLKLSDFEVIGATSGEKALELARTASPDIMLLDIILPGMDGFEVLKELRCFSQMPVIVFSASPSNCHDAIQMGANYFMPKPFNPDEMVCKIRQFLGIK